MEKKIVVVAGGTGNLGSKICKELSLLGAEVRVLARSTTADDKIATLREAGVDAFKTDYGDIKSIADFCAGASCVISTLSGLEEAIIHAQKQLLQGAMAAGVPRFIPSDFSIDYTQFKNGENRNLDFRRQFHEYVNQAKIKSTSVFNGAFMDMLTNEIPMIVFDKKWLLHWGSADHKMGFTTIDNTAQFTARVALDDNSPRYLHILGDQVSPRDIHSTLAAVSGTRFRMIKTGGQSLLNTIIKITKFFSPSKNELYPAWQGMQYMSNMIDKRAIIDLLDNNRYGDIKWKTVEELLSDYYKKARI
jgi:nucleoside-diphosphate-sugar epimerase